MRIQSAGRLGNVLFIWAYAINVSKNRNTKVSIFTDKYHSVTGKESTETRTLLAGPDIEFYNSDVLGLLLVIIDWISSKFPNIGKILRNVLGISNENDPEKKSIWIYRGYFQNSDYVLRNKETIVEKLSAAIVSVERESEKVRELKSRYSKYQVVHIRLGDFINTDFGVISPKSYKSEIESNLPIFICSDGSREEIIKLVDFPFNEIFTPKELSTWETLCLIKSATIFIGANSTLSWWGAFLAVDNGNIAYLPNQWLKSGNSTNSELLSFKGCSTYKACFV